MNWIIIDAVIPILGWLGDNMKLFGGGEGCRVSKLLFFMYLSVVSQS